MIRIFKIGRGMTFAYGIYFGLRKGINLSAPTWIQSSLGFLRGTQAVASKMLSYMVKTSTRKLLGMLAWVIGGVLRVLNPHVKGVKR